LTDKFYTDNSQEGYKEIKAEPIIMKYYNKKFQELSDNSFYIKIGKHTGRYIKKIKDKKFQTSIWIASSGEPLGWAKITLLTKEQAAELKRQREELIYNKRQEEIKKAEAEKEEKRKIAEAEREKAKEAKRIANMSEPEKRLDDFKKEKEDGQKQAKETKIYESLDSLDLKDKIKAAEALKEYYKEQGKWQVKKKNKYKERVDKIKNILNSRANPNL